MNDDDGDDYRKTRPRSEPRDTLADIIPEMAPVSPLEVVIDRVTVEGSLPDDPTPHRSLEIWSRNHVYMVDANLRCIEVIDRETGQRKPNSSVLGTRLAGGQRKYGKTLHLTTPFPVPGTEAIFDRMDETGRRVPAKVTSKIERVLQHVRVTSVILVNEGAWDDVTNAMLNPYPSRR